MISPLAVCPCVAAFNKPLWFNGYLQPGAKRRVCSSSSDPDTAVNQPAAAGAFRRINMQRAQWASLGQSPHVLNTGAEGRDRGVSGKWVWGWGAGTGGGGYYHTSTQGPPYVSEDTRVRTSGHYCCCCCCSASDPSRLCPGRLHYHTDGWTHKHTGAFWPLGNVSDIFVQKNSAI